MSGTLKKVNNLSNLWISAYWRREPFQTIQFDLVNWFDRFTKKIPGTEDNSAINYNFKFSNRDGDKEEKLTDCSFNFFKKSLLA